MILRPNYVNAIMKFVDVPLVKVLSGVRRCGKSTIFEMIKNELLTNFRIDQNHIITRNYSQMQYNDMTSKEMYQDLIKCLIDEKKYYLFLDEVQEIKDFEKVVNDLLENNNVDIYVTVSNSKLMSSEISTYLSGRYVSIPVYTFSFKEYLNFKKQSNESIQNMFDSYLQYGGFPLIAISNFDTNSCYQVVDGIYSTVITRDVSKRHKIRNKDLFNRVVKYIIENVGKTFSANSIVKFLKNEKRSLSVETIYNYLKWLTDAFIIYPCNRYDIQGKTILKTQEKYYLSDVSFKYSQFGFTTSMISAMLENIVFLELKRRGYEVFIGKHLNKEIDFIAIRREEKVYVQVCNKISENSDRELNNLMNIKDHYHKYLVTNEILAKGNENGIEIMYIADFLLKENF